MSRRRRFKPRKDCKAILSKLSLLVNPITLVFTLLAYGGWPNYFLVSPLVANPWFATFGVGDAGDSVDSVYSGLVVYAARLKWQGLVANSWFATFGVGDAGDSVDSVYSGLVVYAARLKWQGLVANLWFAHSW